jgi:hypothetical protein
MGDEIDLEKRMGFSEELLKDCGRESPPNYQQWLQEKRTTQVPLGEFWFYVNHADSPDATADAIKQQIGGIHKKLIVRVYSRY